MCAWSGVIGTIRTIWISIHVQIFWRSSIGTPGLRVTLPWPRKTRCWRARRCVVRLPSTAHVNWNSCSGFPSGDIMRVAREFGVQTGFYIPWDTPECLTLSGGP